MCFFDEEYFEGEVREGFYVPSIMKRAWAAQLEILGQIDEICTRHNIQYFAAWGTLLGAIRHKGYIPWDDDLDIGMKRMDYERFIKIAATELPEGYEVKTCRNKVSWNSTFARVVNTEDLPLNPEVMEKHHGFPFMAGIDLFPFDYIPMDKNEEDTFLDLYRTVYGVAFEWEELSVEERAQRLQEVELYCNFRLREDMPYRQQLWSLVDRLSAIYWDTEGEATELAIIYRLANEDHYRMPVSSYESLIRVPFENTTIPIPVGYEKILTAYYGEDYMQPKARMAGHDYPYFKKQKEILLNYYNERNMEIPEYLLEEW